MSGFWIKLNDTHVRADALTDDPILHTRCLRNLYEVPSITETELEIESDCAQGKFSPQRAAEILFEEDYLS